MRAKHSTIKSFSVLFHERVTFFFLKKNVLFSLLILIDTMQVLDHVVFSNLLVYLFTFMCDSHTHFECFPKTIQALLDTSRNF